MKIIRTLFLVFLMIFIKTLTVNSQQRIVISDKEDQTADPSAVLDLISSEMGFLLPRMETEDRNNIDGPAESLLIFNTETICLELFLNGDWHDVWCFDDCVESETPDYISGPYIVCKSTEKMLVVQGGSLGTNASWEWYKDGCGVTHIGTGDTIKVDPDVTTNYYVRAEGACKTTDCVDFEVEVITGVEGGQIEYTTPGTYEWTVPDDVTSISVVLVGGGGSGAKSNRHDDGNQAGGGGGGALAYKNNISVTPGTTIPITVGSRAPCPGDGEHQGEYGEATVFGDVIFYAEGGKGGTVGELGYGGEGGCPCDDSDGGGCGGKGGDATGTDERFSGGGGGAGGYAGNGGNGGESPDDWISEGCDGEGGAGGGGQGTAYRGGGGGGVGLTGHGKNGIGGFGSLNAETTGGRGGSCGDNGNQCGMHYAGYGGNYGGGSGGQNYTSGSTWQGDGGHGAVRIIWPGDIRQFPLSHTEDW